MTGGGFGDVLRALREARSLTQEELAERAGLTVKAIGALERGERRRPYPHTVRSLAAALELDQAGHDRLVASVPARRPAAGQLDDVPPAPPVSGWGVPVNLIGREAAAAEVLELLTTRGRRLVTLTGPGGVGKTSLARHVAAQQLAHGAVAAVDLSSVRSAELVLPRLAAALGLTESRAGTTVESLVAALSGRRQLVVLDNLEQVLGCAPMLARLVDSAPGLRLLVTSRAPLRVRAEHEVRLAPLDLPLSTSLEDVGRSAAARLLIDRMAAAGCPVDLGEHTAPLIADACRRLDGLPLAIELAAARTRVLGLEGLLGTSGLHRGGGLRDLPGRQRTIAAVVDWSYDLLDPEAQDLFVALSVYSSGFTLSAATALVDDDVLEPLTTLVEHSLVVRVPGLGVPRFRLLQPIREQAAARLAAAPHRDVLLERHAAWAVQVADEAEAALRDHRIVPTLAALEADHADLRAAVDWLLSTGRHGAAARLTGRLWVYLALRDHAHEGLDWLRRIDLSSCTAEDAACFHRGAAGLFLLTGDVERMHQHAAAALALADPGSDDAAEAQLALANAEVFLGRTSAARPHLDAVHWIATPTPGSYLGVYRGMIETQAALSTGAVDQAVRLGTACVEAARSLGNDFLLCAVLNVLSGAVALTGDAATTAALLAESLAVSVRARLGWPLAYSLPGLAGVAVTLGRHDLGARLFGASASLAAESAADRSFPLSRDQAERDLTALRASLGDTAFRAAWDTGRTAGPPELLAWAAELRGTS